MFSHVLILCFPFCFNFKLNTNVHSYKHYRLLRLKVELRLPTLCEIAFSIAHLTTHKGSKLFGRGQYSVYPPPHGRGTVYVSGVDLDNSMLLGLLTKQSVGERVAEKKRSEVTFQISLLISLIKRQFQH